MFRSYKNWAMNKSVSAAQIQRLDEVAIKEYGIPSVVLMENAGRCVADEIVSHYADQSVVVMCGSGNNGGDGFVIARHLIEAGIPTTTFLVGSDQRLKPDARINFDILRRLYGSINNIDEEHDLLADMLRKTNIVVDAIFGVGLNRNVEGSYKNVIEQINASGNPVLAVDVPSGLDATTGDILGACIVAEQTMTFTCAKSGFYLNAGPRCCGRIKTVDIGIPKVIQQKVLACENDLDYLS